MTSRTLYLHKTFLRTIITFCLRFFITLSIKACSLASVTFLTMMQFKSMELLIFSTVVSNFFTAVSKSVRNNFMHKAFPYLVHGSAITEWRAFMFWTSLVYTAWGALKRLCLFNIWKCPSNCTLAGIEHHFYFCCCTRENATISLLLFANLWLLLIMDNFF